MTTTGAYRSGVPGQTKERWYIELGTPRLAEIGPGLLLLRLLNGIDLEKDPDDAFKGETGFGGELWQWDFRTTKAKHDKLRPILHARCQALRDMGFILYASW